MSPLPRSQQSSIIVESLVPDPELLKDDDMVSERPSRSAESRTASPDRIAHTVMQKSRVMLSNIGNLEVFPKRGVLPVEARASSIIYAPAGSSNTSVSPSPIRDATVEIEPQNLELKCSYRVEYQNKYGGVLYEASSLPPPLSRRPGRAPLPPFPATISHKFNSVMELVTTIRVERWDPKFKNMSIEDQIRGREHWKTLLIYSPLLINALRAVVSYYPGNSMLGEPLMFPEPFHIMVWYWKELEAYKDSHPSSHPDGYREECNRHIDALLGFLEENFGAEMKRHQQDPPMCTFEYVWMLLKPGIDVYTVPRTFPANCPRSVFVCDGSTAGPVQNKLEAWVVRLWDLQSDGNPRRALNSRVVLDTPEFYGRNLDVKFKFQKMDAKNKNNHVRGCLCYFCENLEDAMGEPRFAEYDHIPLKSVHPTGILPEHQYLIFSPKIWGFALKLMVWDILDMDAIHDISFNPEVINDLVLDPEENKPLLKGLTKRYAQKPHDIDMVAVVKDGMTVVESNSKKNWAGDFVEGKGEGQIILLHGPPGVGKTCTAESVAEFAERPIISLTCSHIGTDPNTVELRLRGWMVKARRWGAILVIDEADVYLEERTTHDFQRNSLVAIFLNCLEYYQGILFLTTNRVGVFDEAFASRIHISIWYPGFDDTKRIKVWKTLIRRIQRERKDVKVPWDLMKYIEKDGDLKKVEWNAFQTAVAIAEYQATEEGTKEVELKCEYLDQVVKMSKRFKDYLSTLPDGNVAKKALKYGTRNDDFGGEEG
ncbi:hypothetical protein EYC84_000172 [Monilinia fructicola]|uniref:AAA+ ATPase domain-containing protein n=1 Tax=Monilinia fructicola TaxID=38448 RepID=A0A5M9JMP6_MONFR|nr:hypothetical protein EYC84_000172 [Monilinia fructicola]